MTASIGRIVHVRLQGYDQARNNGADVAPAVIVRVWSDTMVNVKVLADGHQDFWLTSINLVDEDPGVDVTQTAPIAFWPARS